MRRFFIVCSFIAAALFVAAPLTVSTAAAAPGGDKCVKTARGALRCSFDGDKVEGGLVTPDGRFIGHKIPPKFSSLIEYRTDFMPEFDRVVQDL